MLDWRGLSVQQAVQIYADLRHRKFDPRARIPPTRYEHIDLRTQTAVTREEALHAVETLLAWAGIKIVPVGDDQMKAVQVTGEDPEK